MRPPWWPIGLLVSHELAPLDVAPEPGAALVIRPHEVPFISYPYEWAFSQLREAALLTLEVQRRALAVGMWLRDASAYNVQFDGGRPVLIDSLSFEVADVTRPWPAYRQFCKHFLAPLALMAHRDLRCGLMLRDFIDGLPLDLAAGLLPGSDADRWAASAPPPPRGRRSTRAAGRPPRRLERVGQGRIRRPAERGP